MGRHTGMCITCLRRKRRSGAWLDVREGAHLVSSRTWPQSQGEREDEVDVGPRDLSAGNSLHLARMHWACYLMRSLQKRELRAGLLFLCAKGFVALSDKSVLD